LEIHQGAASKATRANSGGRVGCGGNHVELVVETNPRRHAKRRWSANNVHRINAHKRIQNAVKFISIQN
jgi:hypothetical protein